MLNQSCETPPSGLRRWLPVLQWLPRYDRSWLRGDVIAGLTVVALIVPEGMAYAQLAGMPPETALYGAWIALVLYAVFGGSRQIVVGASSAIAVMSASIVATYAPADAAQFIALSMALALMAGAVAIGAGLLRLDGSPNSSPSRCWWALFPAWRWSSPSTGPQAVWPGGRRRQLLAAPLRSDHPSAGNPSVDPGRGRSSLAMLLFLERRYHRFPARWRPGLWHCRFDALWPGQQGRPCRRHYPGRPGRPAVAGRHLAV